MLLLAELDTGQLLQVAWVSLVAGVGITTVFSLLVYAGARAAEARREGRGGQASAFGVAAAVLLAVFVAGIILGVGVMLNK